MDITTARWHPGRFRDHFINVYLAKLKQKLNPSIPTTICTTFFLEELIKSERTVETDTMFKNGSHGSQIIMIPTKLQFSLEWSLYIIIQKTTLLSETSGSTGQLLTKFLGNDEDKSLVVISIGDRNSACDEAIRNLISRRYPPDAHRTCSCFWYFVGDSKLAYNKFFTSEHDEELENIISKVERDNWKAAWRLIALVKAMLERPIETCEAIWGLDGEVVKLNIIA